MVNCVISKRALVDCGKETNEFKEEMSKKNRRFVFDFSELDPDLFKCCWYTVTLI